MIGGVFPNTVGSQAPSQARVVEQSREAKEFMT